MPINSHAYARSYFSLLEVKHLEIGTDMLPTPGFTRLAINKFSVTYVPGMRREQNSYVAAGEKKTVFNVETRVS